MIAITKQSRTNRHSYGSYHMHGFIVYIAGGGHTRAPLIMQITSEYANYEKSVASLTKGDLDSEWILALTSTLVVMIVDRSSLGGQTWDALNALDPPD